MVTALARAEIRAETPSVKTAARAVRSLKKKIARITELTMMRDGGKDLTEDQVSWLFECWSDRNDTSFHKLCKRAQHVRVQN